MTAAPRLYRDGTLLAEGFPVAAVSDHERMAPYLRDVDDHVPFPGSQETSGFVGSTVLLVVSVLGLIAYFERKGWL